MFGQEDDKYDDVDDETGEGGRRGGATPLAGFCKKGSATLHHSDSLLPPHKKS